MQNHLYYVNMEIFIWQQREKKNMSLTDLSILTKIPKTTLWRIENKKKSPNLNQLKLIAVALEIKMTDLFDDESK